MHSYLWWHYSAAVPPYIAKMYLEAGLMACLATANCTGHMEKQEMEIEMEMENWSGN